MRPLQVFPVLSRRLYASARVRWISPSRHLPDIAVNQLYQGIFRGFPVLYFEEFCIFAIISKNQNMTATELNRYRLTEIEEPTDEMLSAIMQEVCEEAVRKEKAASRRYFDELRRMCDEYRRTWEHRLQQAQ